MNNENENENKIAEAIANMPNEEVKHTTRSLMYMWPLVFDAEQEIHLYEKYSGNEEIAKAHCARAKSSATYFYRLFDALAAHLGYTEAQMIAKAAQIFGYLNEFEILFRIPRRWKTLAATVNAMRLLAANR